MLRTLILCTPLLLAVGHAAAQEATAVLATSVKSAQKPAPQKVQVAAARKDEANTPADASKTEGKGEGDAKEPVKPGGDVKMSGMSILGNEEAPKSLVLVPWKSSQLGDMPSVSRLLDSSTQPVDKDVFLRELAYYEYRSNGK
jgi:hypothetical protein